jgi:hypothetical protein
MNYLNNKMSVLYNGKKFYPLCVYGDDPVKFKTLEELPNLVYGKFMTGMMGYQPVWEHRVVNRSDLRLENN